MTRRITDREVDVGDRFTGTSSEQFRVTGLINDDQGTWVHYTRLSDNSTYNCLQGAFLNRFTRVEE